MPKKAIRLATTEVDRVNRALQDLFRHAGRGTIKRVELALGLHPDYFRYQRMERRLDMGVFFSALQELDVDPIDFLLAALGYDEDDPRGAHRVAMIRSEKTVIGGASKAKKPTASLGDVLTWLEEMDRVRMCAPLETLQQLRERANDEEIPAAAVSYFLAVCASTYRGVGSLVDAHTCLDGAERHLQIGDEGRRADILQRRSIVLAETGKYAEALDLCAEATGIYFRNDDSVNRGRLLVDRANFLLYQGHIGSAQESLKEASELVPLSMTRYQFTIHQVQSHIHKSRRQFSPALESLKSAESFAPKGSRRQIHLKWSQARLLALLGRLDEAATLLEQAKQGLIAVSPLDALLVATERIRLLVQLGQLTPAISASRDVIQLGALLKGNALAEASIAEIFRICNSGMAKATDFESIIRSLSEARESRKTFDLYDRLQATVDFLRISSETMASEAGVPLGFVSSLARDRLPTQGPYARKLESWIRRSLPELRLALRASSQPATHWA